MTAAPTLTAAQEAAIRAALPCTCPFRLPGPGATAPADPGHLDGCALLLPATTAVLIAAEAAGVLAAAWAAGAEPGTREALGRAVRATWRQWAEKQPGAKPSWLMPWERMREPDREADRLIGVALARIGERAGVHRERARIRDGLPGRLHRAGLSDSSARTAARALLALLDDGT